METKLDIARKMINEADEEMAKAFLLRMKASKMVAEYKFENDLPIYDAKREKEVIERNSKYIEDEELREFYIDFLKYNMFLSKEYQQKLTEEKQW